MPEKKEDWLKKEEKDELLFPPADPTVVKPKKSDQWLREIENEKD